ncbi:MAG: CCA tRNA nucleotidyltransferase [Lachnospirales bacterium]
MKLSDNIKYILNTLYENNFEGYIVGGAVRDFLLNKEPKDLDVTTNATPDEIKKIFPKTYDTGIEHGTITVVVNKENIEVTTYRLDGEYINNRKPKEVVFTSSLYEDLIRRDFTINAMAYNENEGLIDNFQGKEDLDKKLIRGVGDKEQRFVEDALRIYRGIRFSAQLGFSIELETLKAMKNQVYLTKNLSVERIRDEFLKSLKGNYPENLFFYTELSILKYYDTNFCTYFEKNLNSLILLLQKNILAKNLKDDFLLLSLCFLDYDISILETFLKDFKVKNSDTKTVITIVKAYNSVKNLNFETIQEYDIRKLLSIFDTNIIYAFYIYSLTHPTYNIEEKLAKNENMPYTIKSLDINGNDLISLGISGKELGATLSLLLEKVLENPSLNKKDTLISLLKL